MNPVLKKLGLSSQNPVLILNAPEEYREIMTGIEAEIHEEPRGKYKFIQIFAKDLLQANQYAEIGIRALDGDGHLCLCYPKGTSQKYKSDINRTKTWEVFAPFEFEPVSQISVDEDWSAMRFRHVDSIKSMTRKTAATEKGRERIHKNN